MLVCKWTGVMIVDGDGPRESWWVGLPSLVLFVDREGFLNLTSIQNASIGEGEMKQCWHGAI